MTIQLQRFQRNFYLILPLKAIVLYNDPNDLERIVIKLLNQPSLLAFRIECIMDSFEEDCSNEEREFALNLLKDNLPLIMKYLSTTISSTLHVSSVNSLSPLSSANASPALLPKPSPPCQNPFEFDVVIEKEINATVGKVKRSGNVKWKLLQLLEYFMDTESFLFSSFVVSYQLNSVLLVY